MITQTKTTWGTHTLALVCARGDGRTDAVAVFPAGRTRLAVLGG